MSITGRTLEEQRNLLEAHSVPIEFWPRAVLVIAWDMRRIKRENPIPGLYSPYYYMWAPYKEDPYVTVFGGNQRRYIDEERP